MRGLHQADAAEGRLSALLRWLRPAAWPAGVERLHLGCGGNLLPGWANVDANAPPGAIRHDLTQPLPLPPSSVKLVYSEHFIEHLTRAQALALLQECRRVLVAGGVLRLSTPSLQKLLEEYAARRTTEWLDVHWHPGTPCQLVNEGLRSWGHQFVYDGDELALLLREAGFAQVATAAWRESRHAGLANLESRPFHGELIVEATRD